MQSVVKTWQPLIQQEIIAIISEFTIQHARYALDKQQLAYLTEISIKGKQFRGCIVAGFYELLQSKLTDKARKKVIRLAAAIEIHGTAILLHDDIIDKSSTRRGMKTVHQHMSDVARSAQLHEPNHFGMGAAICLADVLFFLADKTVAELDLPAEMKMRLAAINGEELALLGLAEIEDMRLSGSSEIFTRKEILSMFAGKTGRYTGRWPLHLACVLANTSSEKMTSILQVGEDIGVLYQLKDDELGIFGDEQITGKSTSSDLLEGKKTLYYLYLKEKLSESDKAQTFSIIGNPEASLEDIEKIKLLITTSGIKQIVESDIVEFRKKIDTSINSLDISINARQFLTAVTEFVVTRNK
jgi:geranylgeranyl diphosphate synthase type I